MSEADHGLALRGGTIGRLLADPAIAARGIEDRVFGRDVPKGTAWPFIRVEIEDGEPDEASCWTGEDRRFFVNGFTRPTEDLPDAEAEAFKLGNAIRRAMSRAPLQLPPPEDPDDPDPDVMELECIRSNVRIDADEPGAYHVRVEFSAKMVEEA